MPMSLTTWLSILDFKETLDTKTSLSRRHGFGQMGRIPHLSELNREMSRSAAFPRSRLSVTLLFAFLWVLLLRCDPLHLSAYWSGGRRGSGSRQGLFHNWPARFLGPSLILMATLLAAATVPAQSTEPPRGTPGPSVSPPQGGLDFQDKATGDWGGERRRLEQAGIRINAGLVLEGFKNFAGGLSTSRILGASTFDLGLTLDTKRLFDWQGGKFYVDLEDHAGKNPTTDLVGDLQVFDKLNASRYLQIFELWYQQKLFDGKMRVKVGKVDANSEFSVIENGLEFIGSSSQVSPTIFLLPTTPDPMPSVNVFITPMESFYIGLGAYYSNRSEGFGNFMGSPQNEQPSEFGAFLIGEAGMRWPHAPFLEGEGNLKFGFWEHTGSFTRFDGSEQRGTHGYYILLNQTLWRPAGEPQGARGLGIFMEYGRTQKTINPIDWHAGGGVAWKGPLSARPRDVTGLGSQYAHIPSQAGLPRSYELSMEFFYKLQITAWAAFMPDLQYILNPGGRYPNALVGTLRLLINL
jgi:porin